MNLLVVVKFMEQNMDMIFETTLCVIFYHRTTYTHMHTYTLMYVCMYRFLPLKGTQITVSSRTHPFLFSDFYLTCSTHLHFGVIKPQSVSQATKEAAGGFVSSLYLKKKKKRQQRSCKKTQISQSWSHFNHIYACK